MCNKLTQGSVENCEYCGEKRLLCQMDAPSVSRLLVRLGYIATD